jgi:hypothetical protein
MTPPHHTRPMMTASPVTPLDPVAVILTTGGVKIGRGDGAPTIGPVAIHRPRR